MNNVNLMELISSFCVLMVLGAFATGIIVQICKIAIYLINAFIGVN